LDSDQLEITTKTGNIPLKSIFDNLILTIAIAISVIVHAALMLVHFVVPDIAETKAADPGLEVILVNSKHDKKL